MPLNEAKLTAVVESLASCKREDGCDGSCEHCQMSKQLLKLRCLHPVYTTLIAHFLSRGPLAITDAFALGFCLAHDYYESEKLEEMCSQ